MKFEEALKAMREGKKVMRPVNLLPRAMKTVKYAKFGKVQTVNGFMNL